jgi:hypothetical protein
MKGIEVMLSEYDYENAQKLKENLWGGSYYEIKPAEQKFRDFSLVHASSGPRARPEVFRNPGLHVARARLALILKQL